MNATIRARSFENDTLSAKHTAVLLTSSLSLFFSLFSLFSLLRLSLLDSGGVAFSASMVWAQVFPFVALQFHEGDKTTRNALTTVLVGCFSLWLVLNIIFFCTIDLKFLNIFFGTKTAPQYACELFETSEEDLARFDMVFGVLNDYTKSIHDDMREWVANNIARWKLEKPD